MQLIVLIARLIKEEERIKMAKTVVTQEMIKEINELYTEIKTYAGVARKIGIAPTTVKKYIVVMNLILRWKLNFMVDID